MKRFYHFAAILAITFFVFNTNCLAQAVVGKLFTKSVADQKYGPVVTSVEFPTKNLTELLNESDNYIMFKIVDNSVIIINQDRNVLYPEGAKIEPDAVFTMYSKSVVEDLISVGDNETVNFQQRDEVLTVTVGNVTMEVGAWCPPWCVTN